MPYRKHQKIAGLLALAVSLAVAFAVISPSFAETFYVGPITPVPPVTMRTEWNRFFILVWQYQTNIVNDLDLYRKAGFRGFHIDRGADAGKLIDISREAHFPYYVDHAADKGILYLRDANIGNVTKKRGLATRPYSFADPQTLEKLRGHLKRNIATAKEGLVLAYAFDDEISLGHFTTPCDVDKHPLSIEWFKEWLKARYGEIGTLNDQWGAHYGAFDEVMPSSFDSLRGQMTQQPISGWNFSSWMDFRQFMDDQFALTLRDLTHYSNQLDPNTPAGFVGGQAPAPWGGYDYSKISRAVQWMEAYDIHGTNEILRSFWNKERRPRMQTFFSKKNPKLDSWFLWYYLVHGNQAVIAWPEGWFHSDGNEIAPYISANKKIFEEIQGPIGEPFVNTQSRFDADPIGIYYSQPSIQSGWAMDAITHGDTWINR
ncbi:MAG: beta-galactosidase, partial [Syntrophaceae bacterium]|nr:beta-galactosidase [Syntrophaceae bacterium]